MLTGDVCGLGKLTDTAPVAMAKWLEALFCNHWASFSPLYPCGFKHQLDYCKNAKIWTPQKFAVITLKFELWLYHRVMHPKDADRMANSEASDQTAPRMANSEDPDQTVWSGSTLFAQTCLSENLETLLYMRKPNSACRWPGVFFWVTFQFCLAWLEMSKIILKDPKSS